MKEVEIGGTVYLLVEEGDSLEELGFDEADTWIKVLIKGVDGVYRYTTNFATIARVKRKVAAIEAAATKETPAETSGPATSPAKPPRLVLKDMLGAWLDRGIAANEVPKVPFGNEKRWQIDRSKEAVFNEIKPPGITLATFQKRVQRFKHRGLRLLWANRGSSARPPG